MVSGRVDPQQSWVSSAHNLVGAHAGVSSEPGDTALHKTHPRLPPSGSPGSVAEGTPSLLGWAEWSMQTRAAQVLTSQKDHTSGCSGQPLCAMA